ncbi:hypothetical protein ABFY54_29300 [Priestia megaterium]|uniref:hypothetical protein n=1 Tax=Priestia megaterium TaxID=1404 RepID=UPI003D2CA761
MNKMDEIIIVVDRQELFENETLSFQGTVQDKGTVNQIIGNISRSFGIMRRGDAEENTDFKQPIPYAVIKRGNEIFVYERLKGAGEERLHNKLSLGIGGHMNPVSTENFLDVLLDNLYREIEEELDIYSTVKPDLNIIGLINDDSDDVGKVHLGILAVLEVHKDTVIKVRETEELDGEFVSIEEAKIPENYDCLENWSKIVVDIL